MIFGLNISDEALEKIRKRLILWKDETLQVQDLISEVQALFQHLLSQMVRSPKSVLSLHKYVLSFWMKQ